MGEPQLPIQAHMTDTAEPRRRGTPAQGKALESLGHAVEYLIDQRLFARDERERDDDEQAVQLLMRLSRAVFLECPEVVPIKQRVAEWFAGRARRTSPDGAESSTA